MSKFVYLSELDEMSLTQQNMSQMTSQSPFNCLLSKYIYIYGFIQLLWSKQSIFNRFLPSFLLFLFSNLPSLFNFLVAITKKKKGFFAVPFYKASHMFNTLKSANCEITKFIMQILSDIFGIQDSVSFFVGRIFNISLILLCCQQRSRFKILGNILLFREHVAQFICCGRRI